MKTDRVSKLYENLSNKERALLTFHHTVTGNALEADRITAMVPWKAYRTRDAEFLDWLRVVHGIADFWGCQHWKMQAKRLAALGGMQIMLTRDNSEKLEAFIQAVEQWEASLLALDTALESCCGRHGIDSKTIRAYSDAERFQALSTGLAPDAEYQSEIEAGLSRLLEIVERRGKG